jgi:hypothetical protein
MPQQAENTDSSKGTVFKRIAMEYLFNDLTNRGAPVAYVQIPVKMSDGITVKEKINQIQAIPEKDRDDRENETLKMLKDGLNRGDFPATSNIDFKQTTYTITLPPRLDDPKLARETLQAVAALDSRYELLQYGKLYVLCPKDDPIKTQRVTLVLKDVPAEQAIGKLSETIKAQGIDYMQVTTGPTRSDGKGEYGDTKITLNLINVSIVEILSRFAVALGPNYTWDMMMIEGYGRHFGFTNFSPPSANH